VRACGISPNAWQEAVLEDSFDDGLRSAVVIDAIRRSLDEKRLIELTG